MHWSDPKTRKRLRTAGIWAAIGIAYVLLGIDDWSRDWVEYESTLRFEPTNQAPALEVQSCVSTSRSIGSALQRSNCINGWRCR